MRVFLTNIADIFLNWISNECVFVYFLLTFDFRFLMYVNHPFYKVKTKSQCGFEYFAKTYHNNLQNDEVKNKENFWQGKKNQVEQITLRFDDRFDYAELKLVPKDMDFDESHGKGKMKLLER